MILLKLSLLRARDRHRLAETIERGSGSHAAAAMRRRSSRARRPVRPGRTERIKLAKLCNREFNPRNEKGLSEPESMLVSFETFIER